MNSATKNVKLTISNYIMIFMVIACIISGSACCSGYPCFGFVATVGPTGDKLSVLLNHLRVCM